MQVCSKQIIFIDYLLNKQYIATVLCENKSVPQKHCNGKCHLKKELERDSRQQGGDSQKSKNAAEEFFYKGDTSLLTLTLGNSKDIFYRYIGKNSDGIFESIFRPPLV